ncbi:MAG: hypothetical protein CMF28_02575 [Kiritimatiellaceae bacterium]|nr:hypothetical protein [Kiritimatiellaceae bacterium]|tara:strand:- start:7895 stop:8458 length:564 start_codon:yes stop_codon:yes gene_type:complete
MKDQREQWSVRKCSAVCAASGKAFEEGDEVVSSLQFDEGAYQRVDRLASCTEAAVEGISVWRTRYAVPPAPEEVVQKENVEGLLRKRMAAEVLEDRDVIFILAVMLERKKILVERGVQRHPDGMKIRVYEHRKTKESFTVMDPELRLDELEKVQDEVAVLLGGEPRVRPVEVPEASGGGAGSVAADV